MAEEYRIGKHLFQTREEYEEAKRDYEYSQGFMKNLDLRQPDMAKQLYDKLGQSKHLMKSPIGEAFKEKLVQIFVTHTIKEVKERNEADEMQNLGSLITRMKKRTGMLIYWRSFLLLQGFHIATLIRSVVSNSMTDVRPVNGYQGVFSLWNSYGTYSKIVALLLILYGILLMIYYLYQQISHKIDMSYSLNMLLLLGSINCLEVLLLACVK